MALVRLLPVCLVLTSLLLTACGGGGGTGGDTSPNTPPQLDVSNWQPSIDQSRLYQVQLIATDAEGQALSFSATNLPS